MEKFEGYLVEIKNTLSSQIGAQRAEAKGEDSGPYKTIIAVGTTIFGALVGAIVTLIVHIK